MTRFPERPVHRIPLRTLHLLSKLSRERINLNCGFVPALGRLNRPREREESLLIVRQALVIRGRCRNGHATDERRQILRRVHSRTRCSEEIPFKRMSLRVSSRQRTGQVEQTLYGRKKGGVIVHSVIDSTLAYPR